MHKIRKVLLLFLSITILCNLCFTYAAPSKQNAGFQVTTTDLYEQHKITDPNKRFTLESQYLEGMSDEEIEEYYKSLLVHIFEDAIVKLNDYDKWDRTPSSILEKILKFNNREITFDDLISDPTGIFSDIYKVLGDNASSEDILKYLLEQMYAKYKDGNSEINGIKMDSINVSELKLLTTFDDLVVYDTNANVVHGSNITVKLAHTAVNSTIDPNCLYVLHYDTTTLEWELLPTYNVDLETNSFECFFPNLSPIALVYKSAVTSDEPDVPSKDICQDWFCKIMRHFFNVCFLCNYLCFTNICLCWLPLLLILLIIIYIIYKLLKDDNDDEEDDKSNSSKKNK